MAAATARRVSGGACRAHSTGITPASFTSVNGPLHTRSVTIRPFGLLGVGLTQAGQRAAAGEPAPLPPRPLAGYGDGCAPHPWGTDPRVPPLIGLVLGSAESGGTCSLVLSPPRWSGLWHVEGVRGHVPPP